MKRTLPTSPRAVARLAVALLAIGSLLTGLLAPEPAAAAGDCTVNAAAAALDDVEGQALRLINDHRAANGGAALQQSETLRKEATWFSANMVATGYHADHVDSLGRSPGDRAGIDGRFKDCGYTGFQGAYSFYENICCSGNLDVSGADAVFTAWKNSPPHNENMLRPNAKYVGIARECAGNTCFWTLSLGTNESGKTEPVPAANAGGAPAPGGGAPAPGGGAPVGKPAIPDLPRVEMGADGEAVTTIQYLLRHRGADIVVDGDFGEQTDDRVRAFQGANGLVVDGVVGPQTWPKLFVMVRRGDQGDAVRAAQSQLASRGVDIAVDGDFGPQTDEKVRAFQQAKGLTADGVVSSQTWAALVAAN